MTCFNMRTKCKIRSNCKLYVITFGVVGLFCYICVFPKIFGHIRAIETAADSLLGIRSVVGSSYFERIEKGNEPPAIRLLCWILSDPTILETRVKHVKATWARRCDITLYMSSAENKTFPTIGLNVSAGRKHLASKSKAAWKYVYEHYLDKADFFIKTDSDTFVVVPNLKRYMVSYDPNKVLLFGHRFRLPWTNTTYVSGGSGIVLSRGAVKQLVRVAFKNQKNQSDCMPDGLSEDVTTASCLLRVGVEIVDTRDKEGRQTFMVYPYYPYYSGTLPKWIYSYDLDKYKKGDDCCSQNPISFHYVEPDLMYQLDYYMHKTKPAGLQDRQILTFMQENKP